MRFILLCALGLVLAACGSSGPQPVVAGPRLEASPAAVWPAEAPARQAAFSRDGRLLATSDASGLITVRDTEGWTVVWQMRHPGGATTVGFGRDGAHLYSGGYDGTIREWDLNAHKPVREFEGPHGTVWTLDISPDGRKLAAAGEDKIVRLWDLAGRSAPTQLKGHQRNVWEVRFSPDGRLLASGSFDKSARLWNAATGAPLKTITGHDQAVVGLAFSPDSKLLATSGDDSTIRLWNLPGGAPLRTIQAGNHTYKLAFSKDGRWLVSGGRAYGGLGTFWHQLTGGGGTATPIHVWRTADGALVAALPADDDIAHLDISPDGRWLVTSGEDQRFRLWSLRAVSG